MPSYHGGAAGFGCITAVVRGLELIVELPGDIRHFFVERLWVDQLNGIASEVEVLADFGEVFF